MRLAHLADLHLGYRAYGKTTEKGVNQREADVATAFKEAVSRCIALAPDLVVVAGDVFHSFRPSNANINLAFREFARLRREHPAPLVIVAGNHDLPRSYEAGSILRLFENIEGCQVVDARIEQLPFPHLDCAVTCIPSNALAGYSADAIRPDPEFRHNVLALHGTIEGVIRHAHDETQLSPSELLREPWDYIACGHFHTHHLLAPHAGYSGSIERASSNVWGEAKDEKGFVLYDLLNRTLDFVPIPGRRVIDLPAIDAEGLSASDLDGAIARNLRQALAVTEGEGLDAALEGLVVRQVVRNAPRAVQRQLDHRRIRQLRAAALHYELRLFPPVANATTGASSAEGPPGRGLRSELDAFLDRVPLRVGLDREVLRELGRQYLDRLQAEEAPA